MQLKIRLFLGVALLSAVTTTGRAQWLRLEGKPAPAFAAGQWFNTGTETPSLESLAGKVWILKFFATT